MAGNPDKEEAAFRRWLLDKLKQSRWVRLKRDSIETVAARLLVHPDAIRLAQKQLDAELRRRGRGLVEVGTGMGQFSRKEIELAFPKEIFEEWLLYCKEREIYPATVLRSLIQALLVSKRNPRWLGRGWRYRGRAVRMTGFTVRYRSEKWPYVTKTMVSHGAARALVMRATNLGVRFTGLVRGQVLELLEGRMSQFAIIATPREMWDDETRYVTVTKRADM